MFKINSISHSHYLAIWILVLSTVSACSSLRTPSSDGLPPDVEQSAKRFPVDPVPRQEPLSKYGNPPSYVVFGKTYRTLSSSQGFVQRGIASWYGKKFHGKRTSSGEIYDMYGMTAAHTQLPLPTYVQVTNLKNGKKVVLRVNDRGPFHGNRVIDLSYTAASRLGIVKEGTGLVEVRALDPRNYRLAHNRDLSSSVAAKVDKQVVRTDDNAVDAATEDTTSAVLSPQVFVQVGAFGERKNANQLVSQLSDLNLGEVSISSVVKNSKQLHRVRIGPLATVKSADDTVAQLSAMGMSGHRVVIE